MWKSSSWRQDATQRQPSAIRAASPNRSGLKAAIRFRGFLLTETTFALLFLLGNSASLCLAQQGDAPRLAIPLLAEAPGNRDEKDRFTPQGNTVPGQLGHFLDGLPAAMEWVCSPLAARLPPDLPNLIDSNRETLKSESAQSPQASPAAYALAEQLCDVLARALVERENTLQRNHLTDWLRNQDVWKNYWKTRTSAFATTASQLEAKLREAIRKSPAPTAPPAAAPTAEIPHPSGPGADDPKRLPGGGQTPKPAPGISVQESWRNHNPLNALVGSLEMRDLRTLLSPYKAKAESASGEVELCPGIPFLIHRSRAAQSLGKEYSVMEGKRQLSCSAFPERLSVYQYDYKSGIYDRIYLVTDLADQVVAVELETSRTAARLRALPGEWHVIDYVNSELKYNARMHIETQAGESRNLMIITTSVNFESTKKTVEWRLPLQLAKLVLYCLESSEAR